jgi:hypothetical protein
LNRLLILLLIVPPALRAQTPLSVDQLDQLVPTLHAQTDAAAAKRLAGLALTERPDSARLERWQAAAPGKRTRQSLLALADQAAFLDPPAADMPAADPPDSAELHAILAHTVEYVNKTLHKLPDFYALRTTTRLEIATPAQLQRQREATELYQLSRSPISFQELGRANSALSKDLRLYYVGSWDAQVTYRGGLEVADASIGKPGPAGKRSPARPPPLGLETSGEFGPILYTVLADAIRGKVTFSRWEQASAGPLAVLQYDVPEKVSHYAVESATGGGPDYPAYHGEIAVDPASGTIGRVTIHALSQTGGASIESAILVEYGSVQIGGSTYTCPLHGVASSRAHDLANTNSAVSVAPPQTYLNDVSFTQYHLFQAETRILPANGPTQ